VKEKDGLGPTTYKIEDKPIGPKFTFGSRWESDIRAKPHLCPKKVDGPGPGSYAAKSSIKQNNTDKNSKQRGTWGNGEREWSYLPKKDDRNNKRAKDELLMKKHQPVIYNTADMPGYSFPMAERTDGPTQDVPGPGKYNMPQLSRGTAKKILGGSLKPPQLVEDGVPGPGNYEVQVTPSIPGFKLSNDPDEKKEKQKE